MTVLRTPYAGYDVLRKWGSVSWDDTTREVVRKRLEEVPERSFFSEEEWRTLVAVCHRILPQPERGTAAVPIAPWIDQKLAQNRGDGYRYADMPPLRDAWRLGLDGIDSESRRRFGESYAASPGANQDAVLSAVQQGDVTGEIWTRLPPTRFFKNVLLKSIVAQYYAHPAAWSETGFGGPASPRGYVRLGTGQRDPWEAEARHE